jgi:D-arabinose 1-dehydrogenase-like Zn-dependent alcohol dehydrogenase
MKAAIVPSANSKWEVKEINMPEPGENQVLIKIRASGMCYTDVHQTRGESPGDFPRTLGHEPAGEIVAVGLAASRYFANKASARAHRSAADTPNTWWPTPMRRCYCPTG